MKLVSFPGGFGRLDGDVVVPMGPSLVGYLDGAAVAEGEPKPLDQVRLLAPVPSPGKVICVGLNYRDHAAETGAAIPDEPILFPKWANSVVGPGAPVEVPAAAGNIDYEAELAVVIGRRAREVGAADALSFVAGYACANDVSSRELQFHSSQWLLGKAIDSFLPLGPFMATADEVPDPQKLGIRCLVNGEVRQDSSTDQMIFGVAELVAFVSRTLTLQPGDVIATGTPPGVGMARQPPVWLRPGDEVTIEIVGLGALTNPIRSR
ncbi:MAG TPA: fumarylacetoacetate hydrolase family protein [Actinomycetota bacterium]